MARPPLAPPLPPMEAATADELPSGGGWQYEPKWDGFRCLAFRDGDRVSLWSKSEKPLGRYFPEVEAAVRAVRAARFAIDGELVVPDRGKKGSGSVFPLSLSFDALLQRIHPAASRVRRLAEETPARLVVFDLLSDETGARVLDLPLAERRGRLERFFAKRLAADATFVLSDATGDVATARRWLTGGGRGALDGVVAKRLDLPYRSGLRDGMTKVKRLRTADCVVGGFRYASKGRLVGSLLLGLYDDAGRLDHVGFAANLPREDRAEWTEELEALREEPGFTGRAPGGPSRWSVPGRTEAWVPLRPEIVVEVRYDHWSGGRFRHGTTLLRRRPDKDPRLCGFAQVEARPKNVGRARRAKSDTPHERARRPDRGAVGEAARPAALSLTSPARRRRSPSSTR